jgi:membrane-bound lytic murein transglycosylase D
MNAYCLIRQLNYKVISAVFIALVMITGCVPSLYNSGTTSPPPTPKINQNKSIQPVQKKENAHPLAEKTPAPKPSLPMANKSINESISVEDLGKNGPAPTTPKPLDGAGFKSKSTGTADESTSKTPTANDKKPQAIFDEALDYCSLSQDLWEKGELNAALEALDQAYALILGLQDIDQHPKLIQQKEDLRFLISKRILEIYASRHIVVNGDHKAIPMTINPYIQSEIDRFTKGAETSFFKSAYQRSGRYRPYIVKELKKAGLPEALAWLPLIESGFKVNALSRARALGLWQFISSTGYKFGLTRNTYVDERLDPIKATRAAIAYLKELHQIFGDWTTVLAAYNCGEGRVLRVIRSQNVNYLDNFWDLYARLPRETARYVPRFLATLNILENPAKYGLDQIAVDSPIEFETVSISKRIHLKQVARAIGVSLSTLKDLNPELRYQITPPELYSLKVPPGKELVLLTAIADIPDYRPPSPKYVYHRVRRGETVSTIAKRYHTSISRIARANRLNRRYTIVVGKKLKIPVRGSVAPIARAKVPKTRMTATRHKVRKGDSLWNIARRYGTTVNKIQRLNRLKTTALSVGQVLKIAGMVKPAVPSQRELKHYRVKSGDSPYRIAINNQMSLASFLQINRLTPRSKIYPGQTVYIE